MALVRVPVPHHRISAWMDEYMSEMRFPSLSLSTKSLDKFQDWLQDHIDYTVNRHYPAVRDPLGSWDIVCHDHEAVVVKLTLL